jgi:hypothetical protein
MTMGLAGVFGDQAYVCKNCGHSMTMYAPHCPICLNKSFTRVENQKRPGPSGTVIEEVRETPKPRSPLIPYAAVAIVLAVFVALYNIFAPPRPQSAQTNANSTARPEVSSSSVRIHDRPIRHINHANPHAAAQPTRIHTAAASSPATHTRAPMKLWKVSPDADGGDQ